MENLELINWLDEEIEKNDDELNFELEATNSDLIDLFEMGML